ncbi:MAG: N-acetylmuramic acid 6-phosphate etherase [Elusimicrobiota bacterium]|jgi:N-acetylmuramic acid 6-phosphate etherase|nr:N-acetylmuramic acid 6-phosphate etherase [Elusimicrobiota bacterium]
MNEDKISATEAANPRTRGLGGASAREMIKMLGAQDALAAPAVKAAAAQIEIAVKKTAAVFAKGGKIIFIGAGTSGRLGVLEAAECPPTFGTNPGRIIAIMAGGKNAVFTPKEGAEDNAAQGRADMLKKVKKGDIVFGIAASGRTPYVLAALKAARQKGAHTNLITCCALAPKAAAQNIIYLPTGPEALQGSTRLKAASATKMALNAITTCAMALCGKVYKNYMTDVKASNAKLRARAARLVCVLAGVKEEAALKTLKAAGWQVKTAAVMLKLKLPAAKAQALLKKRAGRLDKILEAR